MSSDDEDEEILKQRVKTKREKVTLVILVEAWVKCFCVYIVVFKFIEKCLRLGSDYVSCVLKNKNQFIIISLECSPK